MVSCTAELKGEEGLVRSSTTQQRAPQKKVDQLAGREHYWSLMRIRGCYGSDGRGHNTWMGNASHDAPMDHQYCSWNQTQQRDGDAEDSKGHFEKISTLLVGLCVRGLVEGSGGGRFKAEKEVSIAHV